MANKPDLLKKVGSFKCLKELDKAKALVFMLNPDVLEKMAPKEIENLKKLNKANALAIVQNRPEVLKSINEQQVGYLNELDHNVAYSLICNPKVLSKINAKQIAYLKKPGDNREAASKYIKSLDSGDIFGKVWNWLVG